MPNDDWKTLRVPPEAYAAAKEQKEAAGRTWGEQIVRPDGDGTAVYAAGSADPVDHIEAIAADMDALAPDELRAELDRIAELVERVPERTAEEIEGRFR